MAYTTSDLYKEAINKESRVSFIDGTLTTPYGTTIQITNDVIDTGSFYITNQCVSNDAFAYGSVFMAEAGITLKTEIDRYSLYDARLEVFYNLLLSNNQYERIPLGVFYVNEPSRVGKSISIKAYDRMSNLDVGITESTTGTVFEILSLIALRCNIELAQDEEEILSFPNAEMLVSVNMDRVEKYRELLSYICKVTCSFAAFDRQGKLKLYKFNTEVSRVIPASIRSSSKFSDFQTYFSSASAYFVSEGVYNAYVRIGEGEGLLYEVGEVPTVQGVDETNQAVLDQIFANLSQIRYTPCDITFNGDPSIDLGDKITNIDRYGNEITSIVTFYKWTYRGRHQIKSAGTNPKLGSVKEKKNKDLQNLKAEISAKTISVYTYSNVRNLSVKGGSDVKDMKQVIQIAFATNEDVVSLFLATIQFELDCDGFVEFQSYLDGLYYEGSTITKYCLKGKNVVTFLNYIPCEKGTTYRYEVLARTYCEETELRVADAMIRTNENMKRASIIAYESLVSALKSGNSSQVENLLDTIEFEVESPITTVPTMVINKYEAKASIFGQGLASEAPWDGTVIIEERFSEFSIDAIVPTITGFSDVIEAVSKVPGVSGFTEKFSEISIGSFINILGFDENVDFN